LSAPANRFTMIDGLRGVAASWVVLFHASEGGHIRGLEAVLPDALVTALFHAGHYGVAIFFVLSGFVIAHSLHQRAIDVRFVGRFALRRAMRLDPPYFMSIAVVLAFAFVSAKVKHEAFAWPTWQTLLAHATYTQGFLEIEPLNAIYWTLPYEFQFYLVLCLLLGLAAQIDRVRAGFGIPVLFSPLCALALMWPTGVLAKNLWPGLWLDLWYAFLVGVLGYWSWRSARANGPFTLFVGMVLIAGVVRMESFAIVASCTALLLRFAAGADRLGVWLRWRWLQGLGAISYSLYLTHNPVGGASFFVLRKLLGSGALAEAAALLVVLVVTVACAAAFWFVFERPFIALAQRVKLGPPKV
jgi:peptidoglycan/LPS O-acetylase OafA/YrhL